MKSFLHFISLAIPAQCGITALFVYLNNLSQIPWEIGRVLWYFFLPISVFIIALAYGFCRLRKGGGAILAALLLSPLPILSFCFDLPFSDVFSNVPMIFSAVFLGLFAEIYGRVLRHKQKRRTQQKA